MDTSAAPDKTDTAGIAEGAEERSRHIQREHKMKYDTWLEHGSDDLQDAWVSVCAHAQSHEVEPFRLVEIVQLIRTGVIIQVPSKWGWKDVDLAENQAKVRRLYQIGCEEAKLLNRPRINRLLEGLELCNEPGQVGVVTEQPKGNTKLFYVSALVVDGVSHPIRERVVYHVPQVLGKARADDAKKWTPAATLAGLCLGQRNMNYMARFTGLYPIDLDDTANVPQLRTMAVQHPCVRLVFTSITGSGMRVCALGPVARDPDEYTKFYNKISEKLCREWGVESKADEATFDPARLTFLPYDSEIYFQP